MTDTPSLKFHLTIQAPVAQVYQALSSSASLQSWFADFAEIDAVQGGRFYAWWSAGYYAVGTVKKCQQNKQITLSWLGMDEPEPSKVRFLLKEEDGITHVQIRSDTLPIFWMNLGKTLPARKLAQGGDWRWKT